MVYCVAMFTQFVQQTGRGVEVITLFHRGCGPCKRTWRKLLHLGLEWLSFSKPGFPCQQDDSCGCQWWRVAYSNVHRHDSLVFGRGTLVEGNNLDFQDPPSCFTTPAAYLISLWPQWCSRHLWAINNCSYKMRMLTASFTTPSLRL